MSALEMRFWDKVRIGDGCWEWTAATGHFGYGVFWIPSMQRIQKAHRVSWMFAHGRMPKRKKVLHRCDNPRCVRPSHLFLGTCADNTADMWAKGRQSPPPCRRGSANNTAKLREDQINDIRRAGAAGEPHRWIAARYGVSKTVIGDILRRRIWRHVAEENQAIG